MRNRLSVTLVLLFSLTGCIGVRTEVRMPPALLTSTAATGQPAPASPAAATPTTITAVRGGQEEPDASPSAPSAISVPSVAPAVTRPRVTVQPTRPSPTPRPSATAAATVRPAASPTASPTVSSAEVVTQTARGATTYRVTQITLPTYPYASFQGRASDPDRAGLPVLTLDRDAYEASNPRPAPKTYRLLVLENSWLRLGILPDLGGRIYECIFKPTGANEFYSNTVIKPTQWGPPSPPYPEGAAWWLAAGGMEWGFPVEEHGYEFGTVWGFDHAALSDGGVMITVFTKTGPQAPYAVVDIILPPDVTYFVVKPRIVNPLGAQFRFKWWANAMLAPGQANSASTDLRFVVPVDTMTVHSSGDARLPGAGESISWPVVGGRDLSRLAAWESYLGLFAPPRAAGDFAGVYDMAADEGMVRVLPGGVAKGLKLFAPRGADGLGTDLWTDDGSTYVELHGGLTATFDDWYELGPGEQVTWSELWFPVAGIGGLTFADPTAALSIAPSAGGLRVGLFPTSPLTGRLTVTLPGAEPVILDAQLSPDRPFVRDLVVPAGVPSQGDFFVELVDDAGTPLFKWRGSVQLR